MLRLPDAAGIEISITPATLLPVRARNFISRFLVDRLSTRASRRVGLLAGHARGGIYYLAAFEFLILKPMPDDVLAP